MSRTSGVSIDGCDRDNVRWLIFLVFIVLSFAENNAKADPLVLTAQINKFDLVGHLSYLRDPNGSLTLDDIAGHSFQYRFTKNDGNPNFGMTSDVIWLRLEIQRAPLAATEWWLELAQAYIGEVTLYQPDSSGRTAGSQGSTAGIMFPLSARNFKVRHSTFKINLESTEPVVLFIKLRSNAQLSVRGYLWLPAFYAEENATEQLLLGIYYGAFTLIVFICGLRWWINRNQIDLWWLVYLIAEGFMVFRMNGLASQYILPEAPLLNIIAGNFILFLMILAASQFGIHAFALKKSGHHYSYIAARGIGILALIFSLMRIINLEPASSICLFLTSFLLCLLNCVFSYRFLASGEEAAKFYFAATWVMTGCIIIVLSRNFGFIPAYPFIDYAWQSNVIIHAGLISFGMVLAQRETTNERRRAADFQISAELNQKSSNLRKRMMELVSHEFRNSLSMLNVSMHVISKRKDLPVEVNERHKNIVRVHHQMRRVIDNFLLEERIQNASIRVLCERTDMSVLIRNVACIAELHGRAQDISMDICALPRYLWLDEAILQLVLTNVLDNAVKYSAAGSKIMVHGRCNAGFLHMSVSDSGIGMNKDSLSRIFEPHFKADLKTEGIGIGLYMVRLMLHAHNGDMRVASTLNSGTTVEFWMKVKSDKDMFASRAAEKQTSH